MSVQLVCASDVWTDIQDHAEFLWEYGISEEMARMVSENPDDQCDYQCSGVTVGNSFRHGLGVFAGRDYAPGEMVGIARLGDYRTAVGRYTNHSVAPNVEPELLLSGDIVFRAAIPVQVGEEILINYREVIELRVEAQAS